MLKDLDPNQRPKGPEELNQKSPDSAKQPPKKNGERPLDSIRGSDLPLPSAYPELGDVKYGK